MIIGEKNGKAKNVSKKIISKKSQEKRPEHLQG